MRILYKNRTVTVAEDKARIKGRDFKFLKIKENDVIVVVPVVNDYVIMEKQYRPAIGKYIYELPAGHVEKGENRINAVKREMKEETGYMPKKVSYLFKGHPMPGINTSMHYFYLAMDFSKGKAEPEADEDISGELPHRWGFLSHIRLFRASRFTCDACFHMRNTFQIFQHATCRGIIICERLPYVP